MDNVYLGQTAISKLYLGENLFFPKDTLPDVEYNEYLANILSTSKWITSSNTNITRPEVSYYQNVDFWINAQKNYNCGRDIFKPVALIGEVLTDTFSTNCSVEFSGGSRAFTKLGVAFIIENTTNTPDDFEVMVAGLNSAGLFGLTYTTGLSGFCTQANQNYTRAFINIRGDNIVPGTKVYLSRIYIGN